MKFQQLKVGQKFEYQGKFYIKSSPLLARDTESGEQKLIPRYAAIMVENSLPTTDAKKPAHRLDSKLVKIAFDKFYDCYLDSLAKLKSETTSDNLESMQNRLENARHQFLKELEL